MERLTIKKDNGTYTFQVASQLPLIMQKLGEMEDAEENGLLYRFPVAIGQTVYTNYSMQGWYCRRSNRPYEAEVVYIGLNNAEEYGGGYINISFKEKKGCMMSFNFKDIGVSVFLNRKDAEAALVKMENESDNRKIQQNA